MYSTKRERGELTFVLFCGLISDNVANQFSVPFLRRVPAHEQTRHGDLGESQVAGSTRQTLHTFTHYQLLTLCGTVYHSNTLLLNNKLPSIVFYSS